MLSLPLLLWVWPSVRVNSSCIAWSAKACPLYGIARCPLFRGCFTIGVYGATICTWVSVRYKGGVRSSEVSVKRGSTVCIWSSCIMLTTYENVGGGRDSMLKVGGGLAFMKWVVIYHSEYI